MENPLKSVYVTAIEFSEHVACLRTCILGFLVLNSSTTLVRLSFQIPHPSQEKHNTLLKGEVSFSFMLEFFFIHFSKISQSFLQVNYKDAEPSTASFSLHPYFVSHPRLCATISKPPEAYFASHRRGGK